MASDNPHDLPRGQEHLSPGSDEIAAPDLRREGTYRLARDANGELRPVNNGKESEPDSDLAADKKQEIMRDQARESFAEGVGQQVDNARVQQLQEQWWGYAYMYLTDETTKTNDGPAKEVAQRALDMWTNQILARREEKDFPGEKS